MRKSVSKQESVLNRLKQQLKVIFIFYSSFGDRDNYKLLKNQSYRRMLCDAQICTNEEQVKTFDIVYYKHNKAKSGLTFKEFINVLPEIAQQVYINDQMPPKQALTRLMKEHLFVLQQFILTKTDLGEDICSLKQEPELNSFELFLQIKPILYKIYKQYWPSDSKPTLQKCFSNLQNFMRDFQISPQLVNKSIAYIMFESVTERQSQHAILQKFSVGVNDNKLFGFKKFIRLLVDLALVGARKQGIQQESQSKKIINILERMELSNGFSKIQKLIQTSQIKPTLLVHQQLFSTPCKSKNELQSRYQSNSKSIDFQDYFSIQSNTRIRSSQNRNSINVTTNSPNRKRALVIEFSEQQNMIISKYYSEIKIRFQVFCSFGQTLNTVTLKSIKLSKILKEMGLLQLIQQTRLDLIISNLLRSSPSGKIEYPQFLKILCEIAEKIEMPLEKIIVAILAYEGEGGQFARKLEDKTGSLVGNQDPEVYDLLDQIEKPLKLYYDFYSKNKEGMNFVEFSKFMYDFQLFPLLISKPRLFQIFNETADKQRLSDKQVSFEMFKEAIGLCSLQIVDSRLRKVQKLLLLLQRMNDSNAPRHVLKSFGSTRNTYGMKVDFLGEARKKYTSFYEKEMFNERSAKKKQSQNFDSIMLDL